MQRMLKNLLIKNNSIVILVLLLLFSTFFVDSFINPRSLSLTVQEISLYGMIAVGLSLVMMAGAIDLSVGYQAGLAAVVTVAVMNATGSIAASVIAALASGALMGLINGSVVTRLKINPLIATIATNFIYKGLIFAMTNKESLRSDYRELKDLYSTKLFGMGALTLPVIVFVLVLVLLALFLTQTRTGIAVYVTGGNAKAGELAGINTRRTLVLVYILAGVCSAVAGIFMASRSNAAFYTQGAGKDIFAISACVIGGIKMAGGSGTMMKVLLGIVIMRVISMSMNLLFIPSSWVNFVSGSLLVLVLIIDHLTSVKQEA